MTPSPRSRPRTASWPTPCDSARRGLELAEGRERRRTLERLIERLRASEPAEPRPGRAREGDGGARGTCHRAEAGRGEDAGGRAGHEEAEGPGPGATHRRGSTPTSPRPWPPRRAPRRRAPDPPRSTTRPARPRSPSPSRGPIGRPWIASCRPTSTSRPRALGRGDPRAADPRRRPRRAARPRDRLPARRPRRRRPGHVLPRAVGRARRRRPPPGARRAVRRARLDDARAREARPAGPAHRPRPRPVARGPRRRRARRPPERARTRQPDRRGPGARGPGARLAGRCSRSWNRSSVRSP